jgi:hypothetical protein
MESTSTAILGKLQMLLAHALPPMLAYVGITGAVKTALTAAVLIGRRFNFVVVVYDIFALYVGANVDVT